MTIARDVTNLPQGPSANDVEITQHFDGTHILRGHTFGLRSR